MQVITTREESRLAVAVNGSLDTSTSDDFFDTVSAAIDGGVTDILVDLGDVDYVSSKGLRVLMKLYRQMGEGHLKVANANASVVHVIKLSGLVQSLGIEA